MHDSIYLPLIFLVASFVMAVVRRVASTEVLALWAIACAMILPLLKL